jgi:hypothetical protein
MDADFPYRRRGMATIDLQPILQLVPKTNPSPWVTNKITSVIFPMSLYEHSDTLELICGVNDSGSVVCYFAKSEIQNLLDNGD